MFQKKDKLFLKSIPALTKKRRSNSHKGTFGTLGIIGGALGMSGACILSGNAALKSGCGKVIIGFNQQKILNCFIETVPELIFKKANELIQEFNTNITTWIVGCGLGVKLNARLLMKKILKYIHSNNTYVLFDADALNILTHFQSVKLTKYCIITPHPKEASRLLGCSVNEIQKNRKKAAINLAKKFNCWVVLKGKKTIVASRCQQISENYTGNVGLATSGSGDVLSGIIGSFIAQKITIAESIIGGVWIHGKAADNLVSKGVGPIGLTAHELCDEVRLIRNKIIEIK